MDSIIVDIIFYGIGKYTWYFFRFGKYKEKEFNDGIYQVFGIFILTLIIFIAIFIWRALNV